MSDKESLTPAALDALRARFQQQSNKAQKYYAVMHAARGALKSDEAADAWMNAPLAACDGKTPAELVNAGREQEALALANTLTPGAAR